MRLEMTSLDRDTLRGKTNRALEQLRDEHRLLLRRFQDEARATKSHIDHDVRIITSPQGARFTGSLGVQLDTSKLNAISGSLCAVENAIELLEDVLRRD